MTNEETYIVTGATGGIGGAITRGLIASGARHIVLACRNTRRAEEMIAQLGATGCRLEARQLDLMSLDSVRRFAEGIIASGYKIRTLFNNAGIMPGGVTLSADGYEAATQTNLVSTVMLTELLLTAIADGGSIVFTTSMTRRIARFRRDWAEIAVSRHNRFVTYGRSKKLLTAYAIGLSARLAPRGIRVNCSDPGIVDSGIITMGHPLIDRLCNLLFRPVIYTPAQGAAPALAAATSTTTARIHTLRRSRPIPASYSSPLPSSLISALLASLPRR